MNHLFNHWALEKTIMTRPLKIVGICGSLRKGSYSRDILNSIAEQLPEHTHFVELDPEPFVHYNEDLDQGAGPETVSQGRALIAGCDAVILVTPEFNHGIPGVLKNMLDWLSRPAFASCFVGKPVLFATVAPGALGGVRAQYQLRETFSSMLCQLPSLPEIAITHVHEKIDNHRLVDQRTLERIRKTLTAFLARSGIQAER